MSIRKILPMLVKSRAGAAIVTGAACLAGGAHADIKGPNFACPGKTHIEALICSDTELSAYDRRMTSLFAETRQAAFGGSPSQELAAQRDWLKERNNICESGGLAHTCLESTYRQRIVDLARAAMFIDPKETLRTLDEIVPDAAPMYRAMYLYTTIRNPRRRTQAVLPLIKPYYDRHGGDGSYQGDIASLPDAVASDRKFGMFVAWTWLQGGYLTQIAWPCRTLVTHPALIDTMAPLWGGAADVAIPGSDCRETASEVPGLTELIHAAENAAPQCDGTIQFTTGRAFEQLETAVRLHRPAVWEKSPLEKPGKTERVFRTTTATYVQRVKGALANYYVINFAITRPVARRDASGAVEHLINDAFTVCE